MVTLDSLKLAGKSKVARRVLQAASLETRRRHHLFTDGEAQGEAAANGRTGITKAYSEAYSEFA
jgi:hypothetical protein